MPRLLGGLAYAALNDSPFPRAAPRSGAVPQPAVAVPCLPSSEPWPAPRTRSPAGTAAGCIKCCSLAHGPVSSSSLPSPSSSLPPPCRLGRPGTRRGPRLAFRWRCVTRRLVSRLHLDRLLVRDLVDVPGLCSGPLRCPMVFRHDRHVAPCTTTALRLVTPWSCSSPLLLGCSLSAVSRWHHAPLRLAPLAAPWSAAAPRL